MLRCDRSAASASPPASSSWRARLIADSAQPPAATGEVAVRGRYLAQTVCSSCHGTHLRGDSNPDFVSPDLGVVAAYSPDAFVQLLRKGEALGGRELSTMGPWSRRAPGVLHGRGDRGALQLPAFPRFLMAAVTRGRRSARRSPRPVVLILGNAFAFPQRRPFSPSM